VQYRSEPWGGHAGVSLRLRLERRGGQLPGRCRHIRLAGLGHGGSNQDACCEPVVAGRRVRSSRRCEPSTQTKKSSSNCANAFCPASIRAYHLLEQRGYTRLLRYPGGLSDWEDAGYPLEGENVQSAIAV
jgi:hypothetical protein